MEAVAQKSEELQQMSAVGADIDSVKSQLEEHKVRIIILNLPLYLQFCSFVIGVY